MISSLAQHIRARVHRTINDRIGNVAPMLHATPLDFRNFYVFEQLAHSDVSKQSSESLDIRSRSSIGSVEAFVLVERR